MIEKEEKIESLKTKISIITLQKLFPKLYGLVVDLELKEYEFSSNKVNDTKFHDFKILNDGKVVYYNKNTSSWDEWSTIDLLKNDDEIKGADFETLKNFMILISKEMAILKYTKEEIKNSIREIEKGVNIEAMFKELLTEKSI